MGQFLWTKAISRNQVQEDVRKEAHISTIINSGGHHLKCTIALYIHD